MIRWLLIFSLSMAKMPYVFDYPDHPKQTKQTKVESKIQLEKINDFSGFGIKAKEQTKLTTIQEYQQKNKSQYEKLIKERQKKEKLLDQDYNKAIETFFN